MLEITQNRVILLEEEVVHEEIEARTLDFESKSGRDRAKSLEIERNPSETDRNRSGLERNRSDSSEIERPASSGGGQAILPVLDRRDRLSST